MLKIEELRIGNIVNYFSESAERWFDNHVVDINMLECIEDGRSDHAEGIHLTEQWLRDFLFRDNDKDGFLLIINPYADLSFLGGEMYLSFGQFAEMSNTVPVKYVHQLQNLYFALTGIELRLKGANTP